MIVGSMDAPVYGTRALIGVHTNIRSDVILVISAFCKAFRLPLLLVQSASLTKININRPVSCSVTQKYVTEMTRPCAKRHSGGLSGSAVLPESNSGQQLHILYSKSRQSYYVQRAAVRGLIE